MSMYETQLLYNSSFFISVHPCNKSEVKLLKLHTAKWLNVFIMVHYTSCLMWAKLPQSLWFQIVFNYIFGLFSSQELMIDYYLEMFLGHFEVHKNDIIYRRHCGAVGQPKTCLLLKTSTLVQVNNILITHGSRCTVSSTVNVSFA